MLGLVRFVPRESQSVRITQKKTRPGSFGHRGRRNGTPYVEDANASGLGALFLCPLIIIIHLLLLLFPRSSLLYPPADLFVSYFRALCHTAVHHAHLSPRHTRTTATVFVTTPLTRCRRVIKSGAQKRGRMRGMKREEGCEG